MPYININEYDYTITGPKSISGNIVAVPINASDGPSDKWITVHTYDDFVQIFGDNPAPNDPFGNSWEYAANLLLRNMSVCVRRITNVLDSDGLNTPETLPDINTAKAVIKIKDTVSDDIDNMRNLQKTNMDITAANLDQTILNLSKKGEMQPNELYKKNEIVEEGETKTYAFPTPLALENATSDDEYPETFADVIATNSEWDYIGTNRTNPHYKYETIDEETSMEYIKRENPIGELGDFYITENKHIVKYSPRPVPNKYWIQGEITYPDDLSSIATDALTIEHFIDVVYDATNTNAIKKVWKYTPDNKTTVNNHKFVKNPNSSDGLFNDFNELDAISKKTIGSNYFAGVKSENIIYVFDGTTQTWEATGNNIDNLNSNGTYGKTKEIPFSSTDYNWNSDIYRHKFNWINVGENGETYIDEDHPEFLFTKKIHWQNSFRKINDSPHFVLKGSKINFNKLIINGINTLNSTSIDLEYSGLENNVANKYFYNNIITDTSNSKLTSGKTGLTNYSLEPIKIYELKIYQKDETGNSKLLYDAELEKVLTNKDSIKKNSSLEFKDANGDKIDTPIVQLDSTTNQSKWYIELPPGVSLYYNDNLSGVIIELTIAGFENINLAVHTFKSIVGEYQINLSSAKNEYCAVTRFSLPSVTDDPVIDYNNIPVYDGHGNINLFVAEYLYPGTNGNYINLKIQTIQNRGIYIYVYRNSQYLEKIDLCSFRQRVSNGKVALLDMDLKKNEIWKLILSAFAIRLDDNQYDGYSEPQPIYGNYVKISLNKNILLEKNPPSYIDALYGDSKNRQNGISNNSVFKLSGGSDVLDEHVKHEISKCYEPLKDKYRFDIKFVTNGGFVDDIVYPNDLMSSTGTIEYRLIEDAMIDLAETRKDCVAFLDVPYYLPLEAVPHYFSHLSTSYAAAYDPWGKMNLGTGIIKWMPPSFIQLYTHAKSIQNGNKLYLPPAGVRRAQVPELLGTNHDLPSKYINDWQNSDTPQFINPIIWINGYDYTIYGQKTLFSVIDGAEKYQSALQDLNVRLVANEIKKLIWKTCINLTFELNTLMTWNEFKAKIEPTLSTMLGEGTLTAYDIIMGTETMTKADLNSGHVVGTVRIAVARAATDWDINFEITPNNVTFNEYDYNSTYIS